jgi:hypothetical protein
MSRVVRDPKTNLVTGIEPTPEEEAEFEAEVEGIIKAIESTLSRWANQLWLTIYRPIAERMANAAYQAGQLQGAKDQAKADHAAVKLAAVEGARSAAEQVVKQVGGAMYDQGVRTGAQATMEKAYPQAVQLGHENVVRRLHAFLGVLEATPPNVTVGDGSLTRREVAALCRQLEREVETLHASLDDGGRMQLEIAAEDFLSLAARDGISDQDLAVGFVNFVGSCVALEEQALEPQAERSEPAIFHTDPYPHTKPSRGTSPSNRFGSR